MNDFIIADIVAALRDKRMELGVTQAQIGRLMGI